jgi:hypothetical protein
MTQYSLNAATMTKRPKSFFMARVQKQRTEPLYPPGPAIMERKS